ncbi:MAG: TetR family transcriptional regulator [Porphyrobacter sp.]|nr:TetR family transcriptional regulator [Porphyrobacter sp.]
MARRKEKTLNRDEVLREAFVLLEERGLAGLSMRALAERLDVQAPALYWHFADKAELTSLMALAIYDEARNAVATGGTASDWLLAYGRALHHSLATQRDAARLCVNAVPLEQNSTEAAPSIAYPLTTRGMEMEAALEAIGSVTSLALGWASFEANGPMHAFLEGIIDIDRSFERGLQALVGGLNPDPAG